MLFSSGLRSVVVLVFRLRTETLFTILQIQLLVSGMYSYVIEGICYIIISCIITDYTLRTSRTIVIAQRSECHNEAAHVRSLFCDASPKPELFRGKTESKRISTTCHSVWSPVF